MLFTKNKIQKMDKGQLLFDLYISYLQARRHKRHTHSQMVFEEKLEDNLVQLCDEVYNWNYQISPSIYFIQQNPVKREVFAWNFRDRIVHHLIFNYISPYREKQFIYDSYSCRKGKWTLMWIKRISKFMRSCSDCYTKTWRILKMDIQWYFMAINRDILRNKNYKVLSNRKNITLNSDDELFPSGRFLVSGEFPPFLIKIVHDIIYNDPTQNWIFKWKQSDYNWLPKTKSLFFSEQNCGLPIWNLTSQLFSNIYLNDFDHYVKESLWIKYYGRYVDDFVLIHPSKEYLKSLIEPIGKYLRYSLHLTLHPNKIYLQPINHGVQFLWAIIKPYRIYRWKRSVTNFYNKLRETNYTPKRSSLDSYIWLMIHFKHYKLMSKILSKVKFDEMDDISHYKNYIDFSPQNFYTSSQKQQDNLTFRGGGI